MVQFNGGKPKQPMEVSLDLPHGSLKVLQLTDCHLYADPSQCLLGLNTLNTLDQVIDLALQTIGKPDLVLATGDLVHDASDTGYKRLRARLTRIGAPAYCLPGNHDIPAKMDQLLNQDNVHTISSVQFDAWSLVFLDSTIPGETGGNLTEDQLDRLQKDLTRHGDKHTLICMHHQPVPVGSQWIDSIGLNNSARFLSLIDGHPQVRGVVCGHIHQHFEGEHGTVRLMGTPSTCIQFSAGQDDFGIDACPPGYRWLGLTPAGEILSQVSLLPDMPSGLDLASMGY
ncbi:MAG: 3',5'-cyclic-AMP phosphodiesterase [Gammaproteobacteria bacterium]|nr:3',5'-cyclic-AMP phosphodiesterase [Gammaproteobacteria bacterium]